MKLLNVKAIMEMQATIKELNSLDTSEVKFVLPNGAIITPSEAQIRSWSPIRGLGTIKFMESVLHELGEMDV